jgi:thymidylate kinase
MEMIKKVKRRFADTFRMLNENENIYIINADRPMQAVSDEILDIVKGI